MIDLPVGILFFSCLEVAINIFKCLIFNVLLQSVSVVLPSEQYSIPLQLAVIGRHIPFRQTGTFFLRHAKVQKMQKFVLKCF